MKIRLEGTPEECQQAAPLLGEVVDVVSVSQPYPNRGQSRLVRVYLEVRLDHEHAREPAGSNRSDRTGHGQRSAGPGGSCRPRATIH